VTWVIASCLVSMWVTLSTTDLAIGVIVWLTHNCYPKFAVTVTTLMFSLITQGHHASRLVATRVTLSTTDLAVGVGVQHLWVCDSSGGSCQVSIVSLHTNQPCVIESFTLPDVTVTAAETVPGCHTISSDKFAFADQTVWLATEDERFGIRINYTM